MYYYCHYHNNNNNNHRRNVINRTIIHQDLKHKKKRVYSTYFHNLILTYHKNLEEISFIVYRGPGVLLLAFIVISCIEKGIFSNGCTIFLNS